jgi:hypothetical protein
VRAIALLRRGTGASWRDAIGAFFIWQSTSLVVARASMLALFAKKAAFLRTPKTGEDTSWFTAFRANWAETTLAVFGIAGIIAALTKATELSGPLLAALLLFPTLGLAAAPYNSLAARRASLPPQLRERRRTEYRRDRRTFAAGIATGSVVAVAGVAAVAIALLLAGHHVASPNLVGPAQGAPASTPASQSPQGKATPTSTPTPTSSATTSTPTSTPTPTPATSTPTPSASTTTTPTTTPSTTPATNPTTTVP